MRRAGRRSAISTPSLKVRSSTAPPPSPRPPTPPSLPPPLAPRARSPPTPVNLDPGVTEDKNLPADVKRSLAKLRDLDTQALEHGPRAPSRPLCLFRARLAALGSSALPGRGRSTERPATASGARASRLQSRRCHRL